MNADHVNEQAISPGPSGSTDHAGASILLLSGPNLNLLGDRQPEIYGKQTLDDLVSLSTETANSAGLGLVHQQSNSEGELVDWIQQARDTHDAIIINPGAFTHYSWAIHDALAAFEGVIVELHISNPNSREPWRNVSVVAPVATGSIVGFGGDGYRLAVEAAVSALAERS